MPTLPPTRRAALAAVLPLLLQLGASGLELLGALVSIAARVLVAAVLLVGACALGLAALPFVLVAGLLRWLQGGAV